MKVMLCSWFQRECSALSLHPRGVAAGNASVLWLCQSIPLLVALGVRWEAGRAAQPQVKFLLPSFGKNVRTYEIIWVCSGTEMNLAWVMVSP